MVYRVLQGISLLEGTHWVGGINHITGATASVEDLRPHLAQTKSIPKLLWDPLSPAEQWLGAGTPMDPPCPNLWYPRLPPKIGDIKKNTPWVLISSNRKVLAMGGGGVLVYRYKKHLPGMQPNVIRECFRLLREIVFFI